MRVKYLNTIMNKVFSLVLAVSLLCPQQGFALAPRSNAKETGDLLQRLPHPKENGRTVSRFVPSPIPLIKPGTKVKLRKSGALGIGTVIEINPRENRIIIDFPIRGKIELVWSVVNSLIEVVSPPKEEISLGQLWDEILALDKRIEEAGSFEEKLKLMEERNKHRAKLWDLLKATGPGRGLKWKELADKIGISDKELKAVIYDYLLEITDGNITEVSRLTGCSIQSLSKYLLPGKIYLVRALATTKDDRELDEEERRVIIRELITKYLADITFPRFHFKAYCQYDEKKKSSRIYLIYIDRIKLFIEDRLLEYIGADKEVTVCTEFDPDFGWLFKVTDGEKTLYYKISPDKTYLDLIDPVQETIFCLVEPRNNIHNQPIKPRSLPSEEFTMGYGQKIITEMARCNKFTDPNLVLYPFIMEADALQLYMGITNKIENGKYYIKPSFSHKLGSWVFTVTKKGEDELIFIFSGREIEGQVNFYQLEGEELTQTLEELGLRKPVSAISFQLDGAREGTAIPEKQLWDEILALDRRIEEAGSFTGKLKLMKERSALRGRLLELFNAAVEKPDQQPNITERFKLLSNRLGIAEKDLRCVIYDHLIDVTGGDAGKIAQLMGKGRIRIWDTRQSYLKPERVIFIQALKKIEQGEKLNASESMEILKEFFKYINDKDFPKFLFSRGIMTKTEGGETGEGVLYINLAYVNNSWITISERLQEYFKAPINVSISTEYDPEHGWLFKVTDEAKSLYYKKTAERQDLCLVRIEESPRPEPEPEPEPKPEPEPEPEFKISLSQVAEAKEAWVRIGELNQQIDKAVTFQEKTKLMEERNEYRVKLWNLLKSISTGHGLKWKELANKIEISNKELKAVIYDYLLEITDGNVEELSGLTGYSTKTIVQMLRVYLPARKTHLVRALAKAKDDRELDEKERKEIIRELVTKYLADITFPSFHFKAYCKYDEKKKSSRIDLTDIDGKKLFIEDRLLKYIGRDKEVTVCTEFDPDFGWLFKVTDGEKTLYYKISPDKTYLDLIDPVQETMFCLVEPRNNIHNQPIKPRSLPSEEFTMEYGQKIITEMARCNKFTDPKLVLYPFVMEADVNQLCMEIIKKRGRGYGIIRVTSGKLISNEKYYIKPSFSRKLGRWVFTVTKKGEDELIFIFYGRETKGQVNLYQLKGEELTQTLEELGLKKPEPEPEPEPAPEPAISPQIAEAKEAWVRIGELNQQIDDAVTFQEKATLMEKRNEYRVKLWDLLKETSTGHGFKWKELANKIGISNKELKSIIYDYLLEITNGDITEMSKLTEYSTGTIVGMLSVYLSAGKIYLVRALAKAKDGKELDEKERDVIVKELFKHLSDSTFPSFSFSAVTEYVPDKNDCFIELAEIENEQVHITEGLLEFMGKNKRVKISTEFDTELDCWLFKVSYENRSLFYRKDPDRNLLILIRKIPPEMIRHVEEASNEDVYNWLYKKGRLPIGKYVTVNEKCQVIIADLDDKKILITHAVLGSYLNTGQSFWISFEEDKSKQNKFAVLYTDCESILQDRYGYLYKFYIMKDGNLLLGQDVRLYTSRDKEGVIIEGVPLKREEIAQGGHIELLISKLDAPDHQTAKNALEALKWINTDSGIDRIRILLKDKKGNPIIQKELTAFYDLLILHMNPPDELLEKRISSYAQIKWVFSEDIKLLEQVILPDLLRCGIKVDRNRLFKIYYKLLFFNYLKGLAEEYKSLQSEEKKQSVCIRLKKESLPFYEGLVKYWGEYENFLVIFSGQITEILGFPVDYKNDIHFAVSISGGERESYITIAETRLLVAEIAAGKHNAYLLKCLDSPNTREAAKEALKLMRNEAAIIDILRAMEPGVILPPVVQRNILLLEILEAIGIVNKQVLQRLGNFSTYGNSAVQEKALLLFRRFSKLFYKASDEDMLRKYLEGLHYLTEEEAHKVSSPLSSEKFHYAELGKFCAEFPKLRKYLIEQELIQARRDKLTIELFRERLGQLIREQQKRQEKIDAQEKLARQEEQDEGEEREEWGEREEKRAVSPKPLLVSRTLKNTVPVPDIIPLPFHKSILREAGLTVIRFRGFCEVINARDDLDIDEKIKLIREDFPMFSKGYIRQQLEKLNRREASIDERELEMSL